MTDETGPLTAQMRNWWQRKDIRWIVWIWLGLTLVFSLFALFVPARLMGAPASPTMRAVEETMTIFSVAAAPVMAVVLSIAIYSLIAWRSPGWNQPATDGPPIRSSGMVTATWIQLY